MCEVKGVSAKNMSFDHLIVDFRNFAYRTLHVLNDKEVEYALTSIFDRLENICNKYNVKYENFHICLEGGNNWRYNIFPMYKGNRSYSSDLDSTVSDFIPALEHLVQYTKFSVWNGNNCEGDDIFGTLSRKLSLENPDAKIAIYSSDRDLLQLSTDKIYNIVPISGEGDVVLDSQLHIERYGYSQSDRIMIKALEGDPGDNIPGVYGVGKKLATKLAKSYKTIAEIKEVITNTPSRQDKERVADYKKRLKEVNELFTPKKFEAIKDNLNSLYISYIIGSIVLNSDIYKLDNKSFKDIDDFFDVVKKKLQLEHINKSIIYYINTDLFEIGDS